MNCESQIKDDELDYNSYQVVRKPSGQGKNYLCTIAIGDEFLKTWEKFALRLWQEYADSHDLGIIVFTAGLISEKSSVWKKATWQKFLVPTIIRKTEEIENICYLDTDILVNPVAPNIFERFNSDQVGLVSVRTRLPYDFELVNRLLAFYRNRYYSSDYPLDSALFIKLEDLYTYHNLAPVSDEACAGVFLVNVENQHHQMKKIFEKYPRNVESVTGGGDQTHFNYEIQTNFSVQWFEYRFQAIWPFEMATKYPFLYHYGRRNPELIKQCVEASLLSNYFLHFPGSWYESDMWKIEDVFQDGETIERVSMFREYLQMSVTGVPRGTIKPSFVRDEA
jgi:hypothetical protein